MICSTFLPQFSAKILAPISLTRRVKEIGARILAENCGKKMEQVMKDFDRDYWMDAKESIEYGIVDELVERL